MSDIEATVETQTLSPLDSRVVEMLAFSMLEVHKNSESVASADDQGNDVLWRTSADVRKFWRNKARELVAVMDERGMSIEFTHRRLNKAFEDLRTIPAAAAYDSSEI